MIRNIVTMNIGDESETFDGVVKQAYKEKYAELYTWTYLSKRIIWKYFILLLGYHLGFIAALIMYSFGFYSIPIKRMTIIWAFVVGVLSMIGETAGAHRLWSHRAYKAKLPLRVLLMILYSMIGLNPIYYWVRDHRVHHKYSETDADPYSAKRGFVYSHFGWIVMKKHPDCIRRAREVDMSDIEADSVVMFQKKYATELKLLVCFIIPVVVPLMFWNETVLHSILTQWFIRYVLTVNFTSSINSFAHLWGNRPYNKLINPAENLMVSLVTMGEGSHNYHHTFPWDYKTSELPYVNFNTTTLFINAMAKIGWAYDLREPSHDFVDKVIHRLGYKSEIEVAID